VVGIAHGLSWGKIRIQGPPATDRYQLDFVINKDGGYEITALTAFDEYDVWLIGYRIRSKKYHVKYEDLGKTRAVVDFHRVTCW
jgi:hypothetical protein